STQTALASFSDINDETPYAKAILYAQENNIVKGYEDGSFKPGNEIDRSEFTKIIINALFPSSEIYGSNCFPDVTDEWFAEFVCTAKRKNIIKGYSDNNFHPEYKISFAEGAKIISNSFGFPGSDDPELWYKEYEKNLSEKNAVPESIKYIDQKINRGEMVEIIWRLLAGNSNSKQEWWQPKPGSSWQWQLSGDIDTDYQVEMYDIDLVDTPQSTIDKLHAKNIKVVCYFSAGTWEEFRDDADQFPSKVLGKALEDWPDEKWLDISHYEDFAQIMETRLDLALTKKCDGIEPDNVDGYQNDNGFDLSYEDQITYNTWLATEAHERKLAIGLKNDLDQIEDLVNIFDFAINEQCFEYEECENLTPFIESNKAVFGVEYELKTEEFCSEANSLNFSWLKMDYELDGNRTAC
ncbi:endo alpha-1,4 polygalactosaminidase, partial [Candidatus Peregrinibacteria bacterium]|nr:endo alpha-1,4 polygalactosaminidase [Candidatus Peregrinibacteria bacterium]